MCIFGLRQGLDWVEVVGLVILCVIEVARMLTVLAIEEAAAVASMAG